MTLVLENVGCHHGNTKVLHDISIAVSAGCTALIGANGAGKSTLLRLCAGEGRYLHGLKPDGEIFLNGTPLASWPLQDLAKRRSFLPQQHADQLHGCVRDIMCLAMYPHGGGGDHAVALYQQALSIWELDSLACRHYDDLSGGERQRVQLARTWLQMRLHPIASERLWLLDEPQTALDLPHQRRLRDHLRQESAEGATVFFSTHDINFALRTADRLIALRNGVLCADASPDDFSDKALLERIFDVPFYVTHHPVDGRPWVMAE
ncbi:MAG: ATP-binding cassette domain-containing protein [Moraxellaceae bacterium]|nr:ATP-binding cassette domain-containing protein [Moraxellaceae bacterium]MBP7229917.1 ATP-binding cassette domain-containing protein [Moraxellaceae bacterium]MBP8851959.1 ATP-binding cassette domain-containing protein [Moraxellaceae bacterium]MBP9730603.1 ATP-binding cassette domain-containing protein [Moraxellaceae bacterium]MCC6200043.1 ATP-binding cassette domain-containing protein [Moraxellaceae bacterium]